MEMFKKTTTIDFLGARHIAVGISALLIVATIVMVVMRGINFGIDFTGGVLVEAKYPEAIELSTVRDALGNGGIDDSVVQYFGENTDVLVRVQPDENADGASVGEAVRAALRTADAGVKIQRTEFIGPRVGEELREDGGLAMLFALLLILAYVTLRFQWKFALGAVVALVHDVVITIGFFAAFQVPFDLPVLAALLAVIGYSLNDTIVVFDRIRENFRALRKRTPVEVMNLSLNQTLSRTLMTSGTTLLVVLALYFLGGSAIDEFALALIVGVVLGTYSSIYVASSAALALKVTAVDLLPPKDEEDPELEAIP
ncbi:MAG: protein translocase subunit SecF [Pseudomonadota bacterium]